MLLVRSFRFKKAVSPLTGRVIRVLKSVSDVPYVPPPIIEKRKRSGRFARIKARRLERQLRADGSHTEQQWIELRDGYGACLCCGATEKLVRDHVVALYRGGSDSIDNLQPLCYRCNLRKGTKTIDYRPCALNSPKN